MKPKTTIIAGLVTVFIGTFSLLLAPEVPAAATLPPVVTTDWLAEHLEDPGLIALHIGRQGSYEEGHIPGARSASLRRLIRENEAGIRDEMLAAKDIEAALAELGISDNSLVVIYFSEEAIAWGAARYLLTLEYVGMTGRVAYLDGGLPKWQAEGRSVSTNSPSITTTELEVAAASSVIVDTRWLSTRLDKPGIAIVDGRPEEGYSGVSGHWGRLGHIPGAANIPFFTLMAEEPAYLLKSKEELSKMFGEAGASPGDTVVVYCGTGLWASLPYLAARYLDYEVRLYDGSFQEWAATKELPVVASAQAEGSGN
jgi:thiosulfate/3-mercaptopyruvate sulfurtransferase